MKEQMTRITTFFYAMRMFFKHNLCMQFCSSAIYKKIDGRQ
jgi:hypothetical protein